MDLSDGDLLKLVRTERQRSVGFGEGDGGELVATRERGLKYSQGQMDDLPHMEGRSGAVSTDLAEAIETVLPDVIEVFVGGDDVATFIANDEQDEPQALIETESVNHVVFTENEGFLIFYSAFKDALLSRTGLFHWWWEEEEDEETYTGPAQELAAQLLQAGVDLTDAEATQNDDGTISVEIPYIRGRVCIKAWPSEDFSVASETVSLRDTTYCCARSRQRVQSLIANGIDAEKARALPAYVRPDAVSETRDEAGEHDFGNDAGTGDLRMVEVRDHYIRLLDGKELKLWRVTTDSEETTLLEKEEVSAIQFGAVTPYINAHRFYGESVADKLFEVQKIKTAFLRMFLDSGYFALNQRMEVSDAASNEHTIADLLRNAPNVPVRSATGEAVRPISAGGLNFDPLAALEYGSTMGEARTGIVRNAQGLNPDTLHDTAKGAIALLAAAQKRVRMIARIFAETGVKDMFLGVRETLRQGYSQDGDDGKPRRMRPMNAKLSQGWKSIDPTKWPERSGMSIEVGVGSAGKEHDLMVATEGLQIARELVMEQGGLNGPLVTAENLYNRLKKWSRAAGEKNPELFWSDPAKAPPQPPKPDPEMAKAQAQMQLEQEKAKGQLQLQAMTAQSDAQITSAKNEADAQASEVAAQRAHELAVMKIQGELQLKRETTEAELAMKRELLAAELAMKRELGLLNAKVAHETGMAKVNAASGGVSEVNPGGEPG